MTDEHLIHKLANALEYIHSQAHTHEGWVALEAYDAWCLGRGEKKFNEYDNSPPNIMPILGEDFWGEIK